MRSLLSGAVSHMMYISNKIEERNFWHTTTIMYVAVVAKMKLSLVENKSNFKDKQQNDTLFNHQAFSLFDSYIQTVEFTYMFYTHFNFKQPAS